MCEVVRIAIANDHMKEIHAFVTVYTTVDRE